MDIGSEVRSLIVASGAVGTKLFLDYAPEGEAAPYVTYSDNVVTTPVLKGDGKTAFYERQLEYDLWMTDSADDLAIVRQLRQTLNGAQITTSDTFTSTLRVISTNREPGEFSNNLTHYRFTVALVHDDTAL